MQSALYATSQPEVVTSLVLATSAMLLSTVAGVLLDGSPNSHAQFPPWLRYCPARAPYSNRTTTASTLSFDFETRRASCLVLYADSGTEFVEVRLVRGAARLRLGGGAVLEAGSGLNDGRTHSVVVGLTSDVANLTVDRASMQTLPLASRTTPAAKFSVYVGGLPPEFQSGPRLDELAAPSVAFQPSFVGSVRNVVYATRCGSATAAAVDNEVVRMMSGSGVRSGVDDSCADYDPCQNSAPCLSTDEGPLCDCSITDYVGPFCDLGWPFSFLNGGVTTTTETSVHECMTTNQSDNKSNPGPLTLT